MVDLRGLLRGLHLIAAAVHALADGLTLGCLIGLIAVGYSLVYGIARVINFAHGDLFALGGYATLSLMAPSSLPHAWGLAAVVAPAIAVLLLASRRNAGALSSPIGCSAAGIGVVLAISAPYLGGTASLVASVLGSIAMLALIGGAIEWVVYRPLERRARLDCLVAALGLSLVLQGYMQVIFGTQRRSFPTPVRELLRSLPTPSWLRTYLSGLDLLIITTTVLLTLATLLIAKRTSAGLAIRATADDAMLAARMGVDVRAARFRVFAAGSGLAALSAFFFVARQDVLEPTMGFSQGILAFCAAVIGGIGRIGGTLLASVLIGIALSILPLLDFEQQLRTALGPAADYLPSLNLSDWGIGVIYLLMAITLLLRPRGLLAETQVREL